MAVDRGFDIKEKTPHAVLAKMNFSKGEARAVIAVDIVGNVQDLAANSGIDWETILASITYSPADEVRKTTLYGQAALANANAGAIAGLARHMGWDMHTPEVVSMSASTVIRYLEGSIPRLESRERNVQAGRVELSPEAKTKELGVLGEKIPKIKSALETIGTRLAVYQDTAVGKYSPQYYEFLALYPFTLISRLNVKRDSVVPSFKRGQYSQAMERLQKFQKT